MSFRNDGQACRRACFRQSVRRCISAYAECMTPKDCAEAPPQHTAQPARDVQSRSTLPSPAEPDLHLRLAGGFLPSPSAFSTAFLCDLACSISHASAAWSSEIKNATRSRRIRRRRRTVPCSPPVLSSLSLPARRSWRSHD
jgi:hypothetical protein